MINPGVVIIGKKSNIIVHNWYRIQFYTKIYIKKTFKPMQSCQMQWWLIMVVHLPQLIH